jgi:CTP synthase
MAAHQTKHIFVTGGVVSSLGKGLTSAAIGLLLEKRGLRVRMQKLDPYINVDPGTMSPFQHGEVYVLDDGGETDLDLGHYERFTNSKLTKDSNFTTGRIYSTVIAKERKGEYLGETVQVVPHITNEIKANIRKLASPDVDVIITELGGTVGDIEGLPFLEAIRQIPLDVGRQNCLFIHLTLIPYLKAAGEAKTKPTQHSVGQLRQIGIQPDILIVRTERELGREATDKIALFCNVEKDAVIEEPDKEYSIYEVPLGLMDHKLDQLIVDKLGLRAEPIDMSQWADLLHKVKNPSHEVTIAVVGKYIQHKDAYKSIYEALDHAGIAHSARVLVKRIEAEELERQDVDVVLGGVDGILVPGGFGMRGIEGKIDAIRFARENEIPFFGICLGMQCAVIEFARSVVGLAGANSTEFDTHTHHPVICMLQEQKKIEEKGATMRLGAQPCRLAGGSRAREVYNTELISERHRHRYEFNPVYREEFVRKGFEVSGVNPDNGLAEIIEIPNHPWFVAVQFHPEFKSKPPAAHPLFSGFVQAACSRHRQRMELTV